MFLLMELTDVEKQSDAETVEFVGLLFRYLASEFSRTVVVLHAGAISRFEEQLTSFASHTQAA